jgi:hypothetical protein
MNNTLKILATAIPMTFLAGCDLGPTLGENDFEIRTDENKVITFTCKASKPIMIESITVNNNPTLYPQYDKAIDALFLQVALAMGRADATRWQPASYFESNNKTPVIFPCDMGEKDFVIDIPIIAGSSAVVQVTVKTKSHGTNTYTW